MTQPPAPPRSAEERGRAALRLAEEMLAHFDGLAARTAPYMLGPDGAQIPIACRAGCASCCRIEVAVSSSEALLLHRAIQALPADARSRIVEKLQEAAPRLNGLDAGGRRQLNLPCPLLTDEGSCGVYAARPLACRSHVSFDLAACLADAADPATPVPIPTSKTLTQHRDAIRPRHRDLEQAIGVATGRYELVKSLHILMSRADAAHRIARGDDVLRPARVS